MDSKAAVEDVKMPSLVKSRFHTHLVQCGDGQVVLGRAWIGRTCLSEVVARVASKKVRTRMPHSKHNPFVSDSVP